MYPRSVLNAVKDLVFAIQKQVLHCVQDDEYGMPILVPSQLERDVHADRERSPDAEVDADGLVAVPGGDVGVPAPPRMCAVDVDARQAGDRISAVRIGIG